MANSTYEYAAIYFQKSSLADMLPEVVIQVLAFCQFDSFLGCEVQKTKLIGVAVVVSESLIRVVEIGVQNVHKFQRVFLTLGLKRELEQLIVEMGINVFVSWAVHEFSQHSKYLSLFNLAIIVQSYVIFILKMDGKGGLEDESSDFNVEGQHQLSQSFALNYHRQKDNPQNLLPWDISKRQAEFSQADQQRCSQNDYNKYQTARTKDITKTNEQSPNHKYSNYYTPRELQSHITIPKNDSEEQSSENNYHQLTMKLEKALKKIVVSGKGLNKSIGQAEDIWQRWQKCDQKKKKELQKKRKEKEIESLKQIREKPAICLKSQKIAKESGNEPIYIRFQKIVEQKKRKIEEIEQSKRREQEKQHNLFQEQLNKYMKKPSTTRSYNQYFSEMISWKQKKEESNRLKYEEEQKKSLEQATFKPTLNSKSIILVAEQNRLPIDQRGLIKKNIKPEYTFKPKITTKPKY